MRSSLRYVILAALIMSLAACGLKGALQLPSQPHQAKKIVQ